MPVPSSRARRTTRHASCNIFDRRLPRGDRVTRRVQPGGLLDDGDRPGRVEPAILDDVLLGQEEGIGIAQSSEHLDVFGAFPVGHPVVEPGQFVPSHARVGGHELVAEELLRGGLLLEHVERLAQVDREPLE